MTDKVIDMVREFNAAFSHKPTVELQRRLVNEEVAELQAALENLVKEVGDVVYSITGYFLAEGIENIEGGSTALERELTPEQARTVALGLTLVDDLLGGRKGFEKSLHRLHLSNMSKLDDNGLPIRDEGGKVLKSNNYKPPVFADLMVA